jgi:hypothetical protein
MVAAGWEFTTREFTGCGFPIQSFPRAKTHIVLHVMWQLQSDLNQQCSVSINFCKTPQYQISWKFIQSFSSCDKRSDGRTDFNGSSAGMRTRLKLTQLWKIFVETFIVSQLVKIFIAFKVPEGFHYRVRKNLPLDPIWSQFNSFRPFKPYSSEIDINIIARIALPWGSLTNPLCALLISPSVPSRPVPSRLVPQCLSYKHLSGKNTLEWSDVLTAVKMSMLVFWVVASRGLVSGYQGFGGTYLDLHTASQPRRLTPGRDEGFCGTEDGPHYHYNVSFLAYKFSTLCFWKK